ncbi:MAG: BTAD domain-containing putative transcriptional regulator, partial [Nocardioides sp.]
VVLAALLLNANRPVSVERLVDILWGESPPSSARVTVQNYVRRIRVGSSRAANDELIETTAEGYRAVVASDQLDLLRFEDLVGRARSARAVDEARTAVTCYRDALSLWTGEPLPDLVRWLAPEVSWLTDLHLTVVEEWAEFELASGDEMTMGRENSRPDLVGQLSVFAAKWPLRESLRSHLMRALHAEGRTADALSEYAKARTTLVSELGVEPGPKLRAAHREVLRGGTGELGQRLTPSQLPRGISLLAARERAVADLDALLDTGSFAAGAIAVVTGTAGVGKTTLAVHWAQRIADRFPDGNLFVNLRGYDVVGLPVRPEEALRGFLQALGVAEEAVPKNTEAMAGLYRSVLADRRVLVVLDNAADAEQVRPLLPGAGDCVTVVTSRDRLLSLTVVDEAGSTHLELLTEAESMSLLRGRLGGGRVEAEPGAVSEIVARCAGLPLALSIAAARVAADPQLPLATLAAHLANPGRSSLDVLRFGDRTTELRSVLSRSTDVLDEEVARVFRLLGLHPGPDFTAESTAHLVARSQRQAHVWLDDLCRASLLIEHRPGRYSFHDLLRSHAMELAADHEALEEQTAALRRFFGHLLDTASIALNAIYPPWTAPGHPGSPSAARTSPDDCSQPIGSDERMDPNLARAWLNEEDGVVAAAIQKAAEWPGLEGYAWRLAKALTYCQSGRGLLGEAIAILEISLAACLRTDDRAGEASVRRGLGQNYMRQGLYADAERELRASQDLRHDADASVRGVGLLCLAGIQELLGDRVGALDRRRVALALLKEAGDDLGVAMAENDIGWGLTLGGRHDQALDHCLGSLAIFRALGNRLGIASTLDSLGHIYLHLGRHADAITSYVEAVGIIQEEKRYFHLTNILDHLGAAYHSAGDHGAARSAWQLALDLLEELGHPNAAVVRSKLDPSAPKVAGGSTFDSSD